MKKELIEKLKELATSYGMTGTARGQGVHDGILLALDEIEKEKLD